MNRQGYKNSIGAITVCLCIAGSPAVMAQQTGGAEDSASNEIVVTAQRREQSLKDVPIAVSAFSSEQIDNYQIEGLGDYAALTPNLGFTDGGSPIQKEISIRGVSNIGGTVAPVAIYVDEFNTTAADFGSAFDVNLLDIERIEVLRGPQGTLFGRNVSGGAISITTKKPSDVLEGNVEAEYGSFDHYRVKGAINIPIADGLAFRTTAFYEQNDGFLENRGPSGQSNDIETWGVRGAIRFEPSDDLVIDATATYIEFEQGLNSQVPTGQLSDFISANGFPVDPFGAYADIGFFPDNRNVVSTNDETRSFRDTLILTGRIEKDFGPVTGILNVGYMELDSDFSLDADFTPNSFFIFPNDSNNGTTYSVEPRLQSNAGGDFDWTIGAIYAKDEVDGAAGNILQEDLIVGLFGFPPEFAPVVVEDTESGTIVETLSVFGDVTWRPASRLSLSAGLRYSSEEVTEIFVENPVFDIFVGAPDPGSSARGSRTFNTVSARISGVYELTDDVNLYATISRGVRPGGFNVEALSTPGLPDSYGSETVMNYEAGLKGTLFDGSLRFSLAGYYLDWSDLQNDSVFFVPGTVNGFVVTTSAGGARSFGLEAEFNASVVDNLTIDGGFGVQDAQFDDFQTIDGIGNPVDASGNDLPLSSDFTGNIAAQYNLPVSDDLELFLRGEFAYRSSYFESALNRSTFGDKVPGYETVNLRAGFEYQDIKITAYGENLTEKRQNVGFIQGTAGLVGILATVRPRRFGVRASFNF